MIDTNYVMALLAGGWIDPDYAMALLDDEYSAYLDRAERAELPQLSYSTYRQLLGIADELEQQWRDIVVPYLDTDEPMPPLVRRLERELARQLDQIDAMLGF